MSKKAFISHTKELAKYPERYPFLNAATDGVRDAGWVVVEMHYFNATPTSPADESAKQVKASDAYLVV